MRFSFALTVIVGGSALLTVTACQVPEPVKGTVVEREYRPAKDECYELEIRTSDGSTVNVCDEAAWHRLDVEDPYDSTQDYSREDQ